MILNECLILVSDFFFFSDLVGISEGSSYPPSRS